MRSPKYTALVALSMLTASTVAIAQSAPAAVGSTARAGVDTQDTNELRGTTSWILAAITLALIIWGIDKLASGGSDADPIVVPVSP